MVGVQCTYRCTETKQLAYPCTVVYFVRQILNQTENVFIMKHVIQNGNPSVNHRRNTLGNKATKPLKSFKTSILLTVALAIFGWGNALAQPANAPITRSALETMIRNGDDVTQVNTSEITDMNALFQDNSTFNQDISSWNVGNVTDMSFMFFNASSFNADLSQWDVGKVTTINSMFSGASAFNADLSQWDVGKVTTMAFMFSRAAAFNADLSEWNVGNVTTMRAMFRDAVAFNADLSQWDVGKVTNMSEMFENATAFNADLSDWDVGNVTTMRGMFDEARAFNADLSQWDVGKVTDMRNMFADASSFNADLSQWDVGNVTNMWGMFFDASSFNADLSGWNVCMVTDFAFFSGLAAAWTQPRPSFGTCIDPTNHPMDFTATVAGPDQIDLSWTDATGTVIPTGYIIYANETGSFTAPTDGISPSPDANLSDGSAVATVAHGGRATQIFRRLTAGTTYHFQIWAYHGTGSRINYLTDPAGPTVSAVPIHPQPDSQPTVFAATSPSPGQIDLSWTDATGANAPTGYVIYANETGTFTVPTDGTAPVVDDDLSNGPAVVTVDQGTGTYSFTGLAAGTTYHFQIWAYSNTGSNIDYVSDPVGPTASAVPIHSQPDSQPTVFAATSPSPGQIDLSWTDATGTNAPTGYVIYANETGSFTAPTDGTAPVVDDDLSDGSAVVTVAHGGGAVHSFTDLTAGTTYHFQIWAYHGTGSGINYLTDPASPTVSAVPIHPQPDSQPTVFAAASPSPGQIDLSWTDAAGANAPTGYVIYANETGSFTAPTDGTAPVVDDDLSNGSAVVTVDQGTGTYSFTGLAAGTTYHFQIWAYSNTGSNIDYVSDPAGPTASAVPIHPQPDSQPTVFAAASPSPGQIDLSWTDATGTNAPTGYVIYANETGSFTAPTDGTAPVVDDDLSNGEAVVTVDQDTGTYSFTDLTAGTTYHFQIWAYSNTGSNIDYVTDPAGPTVSAVPIHPQPDSQPTIFAAASPSPGQIDLSWTDATGTNAPTGYVIYANETGSFTVPTDGTAPVVDDDLSNGSAAVTVDQGTGTYSFTGLTAGTTYHFQIWAYSNTGSNIDYVSDPAGPTVSVTMEITSTEGEDQPSVFALEQNYPNPFNPSTTISYSLADHGKVSLSVHNLLGQKVAQLVNEAKVAGSYNVTWNASGAGSGVYYYRLEAGGQVLTRKMMLVK